MTHRRPRWVRAVAAAIFGLVFAAIPLFMIVGSLRRVGLPPPHGFDWIPRPPAPSNYGLVSSYVPIVRQMSNSMVVAAVAVPLTIFVASWAGFVLARGRGRARTAVMVATAASIFLPVSALWVPRFLLFDAVGVIGSPLPLIAPALFGTSPFFVLLFALAYRRVPPMLYEAAAIEGLSPLGIWRRIAWPLTRPVAGAVALLAFVWHWSNFTDALLYLSDPDRATIALGLRSLQTLDPTNFPVLLAGSVLATLPPAVVFLLVQRSFFRTVAT